MLFEDFPESSHSKVSDSAAKSTFLGAMTQNYNVFVWAKLPLITDQVELGFGTQLEVPDIVVITEQMPTILENRFGQWIKEGAF